MTRFVGRENVRKHVASLAEQPGRTRYAHDAARIETADRVIVVRPAFGLHHEAEYGTVELAPLFDALARDHVVAVLLVSLGGYAVGVLDGEELVASKVGSRFVKGRHRKGGSSANRFRRRRDEQARALVDEAAATAQAVLAPWRGRVEFAALGGDRAAAGQALAARAELSWIRDRAIPRFFPVPRPRHETLRKLPYDLYAAEVEEP
jgi:Actinobacteria/chloroflexi VLRF1 release factor